MSRVAYVADESIIKRQGAPRIMRDGAIASIDDHEVIFAPYVRSGRERQLVWGLRKYNVHSDRWSRYIPYPKGMASVHVHIIFGYTHSMRLTGFLSPHHTITFNPRTYKIYFYSQSSDREHITILDVRTQKFITFVTDYGQRDPGLSPSMLAVNGNVHILSTEYAHSKHCVWNDTNLSLDRFNVDFPRTIHRVAMVHVPSRGQLLLIRWYGIWTYGASPPAGTYFSMQTHEVS